MSIHHGLLICCFALTVVGAAEAREAAISAALGGGRGGLPLEPVGEGPRVSSKEMLTGTKEARNRVTASSLRPSLRLGAWTESVNQLQVQDESVSRSRILWPALLSAAVPGAGEIATGHIWNGLPLLAAEVATWAGYVHFQNEGERWRDEYQQFADEHWNYDDWQTKLQRDFDSESSGPYWWNEDFPHNCDCSPPYIPKDEDPQEYYENAGKYRHFWVGWDDWVYNRDDPANSDSQANRRRYVDMRIESNNNFDNRTRMLGVAALTRVVSVLQSIWLVKRDARREGLMLQPVSFGGLGSGIRLSLSY